jgi:PAS domain S-box-containing protein
MPTKGIHKKNELLSQILFRESTDAIFIIDSTGNIVDSNRAAEKLFHQSHEVLLTQNLMSFLVESKISINLIVNLFNRGSIDQIPVKLNGPPHTAHLLNGKTFLEENQPEKRAVILMKEISGEKFNYNYSLSLIEASHDPLITINIDGKITDMNQATVNITGLTRKKLTGTDFFDYFTEPQKARDIYQEVFENGSVADSPLTLKHKDGKLTDVLFNGSVYKNHDGKVLGVVIVARDVSDQNRVATELIEARIFAELATGLAEIAKNKAESATQIAEESVKTKQQFLSNMSHEIRTPMNAIIGFTKVVLKTELTPKQREYVQAIKISGDALIVLINDILDLAKVEAGKMSFEEIPFRLESSMSAMLHLFENKIQEKNLQLIKEYDNRIPEVLAGDPIRLHQIILNLVGNAVKFTSKGSITVKIKLLAETNEKVTIAFDIGDTGIGIENDKLDRIFENFQQASNTTSRLFGGTGLGLAIVKKLVEGQNGTVKVKSKQGVGSNFIFTLSFHKTKLNPEPELPEIKLTTNQKKIKVLVAEDMELNQLLMKTLLEDYGFEGEIAANGKIAVEKLREKQYDIILMDLQMPEMNGFEATSHIRNKMKNNIPIIALTADVTTMDLNKCKAVGMNDYVPKPLDEKLLLSKIIKLVSSRETYSNPSSDTAESLSQTKYIDLTYLKERTKSNPTLLIEMITIYLEQTPTFINGIKESLAKQDFATLEAYIHKMIPSFSIMGIHKKYETLARQLQEYAIMQQTSRMQDMVITLENVFQNAQKELEEELSKLKQSIHE